MKKLNYAGPSITSLEIKYVNEAVRNGFYENYKLHTSILEKNICKLLKVKYALAVNSCTAALHLSLLSLNIKNGDEVITSDSTCVAAALPIVYVGAKPVFVDIDPKTWCMSPKNIEKAITKKTKAILVVHWNGYPSDMKKIKIIAKKYKLKIIEDAAAALGAKWKRKYIGTIGDIGTFSFQGAKVAIGSMGGVLVTNSKRIYKKSKIYSEYGRTDSKKKYWSDYIGFNYSMPNLSAALANAQIKRLTELVNYKRKIFSWYEQGLKNINFVHLKKEYKDSKSTYCYPIIEIISKDLSKRDKILKYLNSYKIDARCAQPRCSEMPMFNKKFNNKESYNAENFGIILPAAYNLLKKDIKFICKKIKEYK